MKRSRSSILRRIPLGRVAALAATIVLASILQACGAEPPLLVSKRESLLGQGTIIQLTNTSDEFLHELVVTIEAPGGETRTHALPTLAPHTDYEIGWLKLDGWPVPPDAEVTVKVKDYRRASGPWK